MDDRFIYIIGKPDPQAKFLESIHRLGYKAGVLLDSKLSLKHPEIYDRVVIVDFALIDDELPRLGQLDLSIYGLVCTYENYIIAKAKIGHYFNVATTNLESAQLSTDKLLMRQAFLNKDSSITPSFTSINSIDDALAFANDKGYPLIIKPTNLVKSLLVMRCNDDDELVANFTYAQNSIEDLYKKYNIYGREPQLIIEEYITGKTCSIAAFVDADGIAYFCQGIAGLTNAQEIGIDDNYVYTRHLPIELNDRLNTACFEVARKGIEALDMRSTAAHVELIYKGDDVKLIEIGARIGGYRPRMYDYSYGLNLFNQEVRLAIGKSPQLDGVFKAYSAVYELFPNREGSFDKIVGLVNTDDYMYYSVRATRGQVIGPAKNGYKAAATIIVVSSSKVTFASICQSVDRLSVGLL